MSKFVLHANATNRATILANAISFLHQLPSDKSWEVSIEKHTKAYTGKQRRSMFGVAYKALMDFAGLEGSEDKRQLHSFMCREHFGEYADKFGNMHPIRTTTIDEKGEKNPISVADQLKFYAFLQRKGAEVGCWVPDPEPQFKDVRHD